MFRTWGTTSTTITYQRRKTCLQFLQLSPPPLQLINVNSRIGKVIGFFGGLCEGPRHKYPRFTSNNPNDKPHTFLSWFIYLCPMGYIKDTLITSPNGAIEGKAVTIGEFLK